MPSNACILANCSTNCHIVTLEGHKVIYNAILKLMKKSIIVVVLTSTLASAIQPSQDPDDMFMVPQKFVLKEKFSK